MPDKKRKGQKEDIEQSRLPQKSPEKNSGEGESLFRTLAEKSLTGIYVIQNGRFCFVNPITAAYTGYSQNELIGKKAAAIIHPDDKKIVRSKAKAMLRGEQTSPYEYRILTKSGQISWIMETVTSISFNNKQAVLGNSVDYTDHKKTEQALKASEEKYRSVVDYVGIGITLISPNMEILALNQQMQKWFPGIDLSQKPICYEAFHNPPSKGICSYCPTIKTLQDGNAHEVVTDTPRGGEIKHFRTISSPIKDQEGNVISVIEMVDDITENKQIQEKLQASEIWYRILFETTGAVTLILELDNTVCQVNNELERQFGYTKEEVENKMSWTTMVGSDDVERLLYNHRLRRVDPKLPPRSYEFKFLKKNGEPRNVIMTVDLIPGTTKSICSLLDITELKHAGEALEKRSQELEAKTHELEELNAALRVLLKHREEDKNELEEKVLSNIKKLVMPHIDKLKRSKLDEMDKTCVTLIESNLKDIVSPFAHKLSSNYLNLTPRELQIANLIKEGKTTKEIANFLNTSASAINICRYRLRHKLGLNLKKHNLQSYLSCLS
jgi:PAS domain S-box-containing protein